MSTREQAVQIFNQLTEEQLRGFILMFHDLVSVPMIPEEEPQKTSNIGMIVGIIAAVAAGIVVVVVVVKLRKKKKAAKLLQEDLLDLNQKDDQQ